MIDKCCDLKLLNRLQVSRRLIANIPVIVWSALPLSDYPEGPQSYRSRSIRPICRQNLSGQNGRCCMKNRLSYRRLGCFEPASLAESLTKSALAGDSLTARGEDVAAQEDLAAGMGRGGRWGRWRGAFVGRVSSHLPSLWRTLLAGGRHMPRLSLARP